MSNHPPEIEEMVETLRRKHWTPDIPRKGKQWCHASKTLTDKERDKRRAQKTARRRNRHRW